jgi:prepilin-type N-terminal cleavage/methylation domain-containing protein
MSEYGRRRDAGMTLPELLVAIVVIGVVTAVLSSVASVSLRQQRGTEGRLNVARAEQNVGMWVPADLASASTVDTDPAASPCGESCPADVSLTGSNALMMSWTTGTATTNVSYHFAPNEDGRTFDLIRIECTDASGSWACSTVRVLSELPGPPGGETFVPRVTRPTWVILVSEPLAADATSEDQVAADDSDRKDANRVVVTINGGGDTAGAGGGVNQISITAGGTTRGTIPANSLQGAPSFVEARSRCGGPMALVIDESNSIGSSINSVRSGVRAFVEALAGTPVKLQVVRFQTYSDILGAPGTWHRYFDMTNEADVDALLNAISGLQGSWPSDSQRRGGTNWEEALFRTFRNSDGTTASVIPETVVFFTDGVPTFDRLGYRTSPGVLPAEPPAPGLPWPESTGSEFSQVAFNRANHIATVFRSSVRLIGVGVGSGITQTSQWIVDPGAGYRTVWERGSYSHVRDTTVYEARYQVRSSNNAAWQWATKSTYDDWNRSSNRRRDRGWTEIDMATYLSLENPPNQSSSDGLRISTESTPVSTAEFEANAGNPQYRAVAKVWAAGPDWEPWTGSRPGSSSHYRTSRVYNSPPFEDFEPAQTATTRNDVILARLIAGNDHGTAAVRDGSGYANTEVADLYVLPQWSEFPEAMQAVALGECGGTLTLQTRVGSSPAVDPFRYQNTAVRDSSGTVLPVQSTVVTTNRQFTTGTFDLAIPDGQFVTVDILPQNFSELTAYTPGSWNCRAGVTARSHEVLPIADSAWSGLRVRVAANEAVSCTLTVSR